MRSLRWLTLALVTPGCGEEGPSAPDPAAAAAPRVRVLVAAASDLRRALPALVEAYRRRNPDVAIVATYGASAQLAEQVKAGAPFALFLSANEGYLKGLVDAGSIRAETARPYAVGSLVIVTGRESKAPLGRLEDLARPEYRRIAIANPKTAPYGAAARQAMEHNGLWARVRLNLVFAESVRQALQFVETGNADAALVGRALTDPDRHRVVEIEPGAYDPIVQWLGVAAHVPATEGDEAARLADFITADDGQAILESFGFRRADPAGPGSGTSASP